MKQVSSLAKKSIQKAKQWFNVWFFVIVFGISIPFLLFFWRFLLFIVGINHWAGTLLSIFFLFSILLIIMSLIIAISETNKNTSAVVLLIIGSTVAVLGYRFTQGSLALDWNKLSSDFYANISSELISIVLTVWVIENLANRLNWREYQRDKETPTKEKTSYPQEKNTINTSLEEKKEEEEEEGNTNTCPSNRKNMQKKFLSKEKVSFFKAGIVLGSFFGIVGAITGYAIACKESKERK